MPVVHGCLIELSKRVVYGLVIASESHRNYTETVIGAVWKNVRAQIYTTKNFQNDTEIITETENRQKINQKHYDRVDDEFYRSQQI